MNPLPRHEISCETAAYLVLAALGLALFSPALALLPLSGDDHRQLAAVLEMESPLGVLAGSFWGEHPYYRPLHTLLLWLGADVFSVRWWPHQALSLGLHLLVSVLLFRVLRIDGARIRMALLMAALYLVSIHTMVTAVWVAARTDLMVGACLLGYLLHERERRAVGRDTSLWLTVTLSLLALMSKESGVIVPILAMGSGLLDSRTPGKKARWPLLLALGAALLFYFLFRIAIFGTFASDTIYEERPLLLFEGRDLSDLPPALSVVGRGETALKNTAALALPVFDNQGLWLSGARLWTRAPLWILTPVLLALALCLPLRPLQLYGLGIIVLSSCVHSFFYAGYLLYLGQVGLCLLVGGTLSVSPRRQRMAEVVCAVLILIHVVHAGRFQSDLLASQRAELERWKQSGVPAAADPELAAALLRRY